MGQKGGVGRGASTEQKAFITAVGTRLFKDNLETEAGMPDDH